jgi:hypothetical protein
MSKVIKSPVDHFAGEVTLSDPLNFPQVFAFRDAMAAGRALIPQVEDDAESDEAEVDQLEYNFAVLPGILACVEKWDLDNVPANPELDTFPATPSLESNEMLAWLLGEVVSIFRRDEPDPEA